jgi:hypothetical protein
VGCSQAAKRSRWVGRASQVATAALFLTGCGRIGFDALGASDASSALDGGDGGPVLDGALEGAGPGVDAGSPIQRVGVSMLDCAVRSSFDFSRPAALQAGDVLLAMLSVDVSTTISATAPPGRVFEASVLASSRLFLFYRAVAGAAEPPTYTFTLPSAFLTCGALGAWTGVDAVNPIETGHHGLTTSNPYAFGSLTTVRSGTMLVVEAGLPTVTGPTFSSVPAGMTVLGDVGGAALFDGLDAAAGTTPAMTATASVDGQAAYYLRALEPR